MARAISSRSRGRSAIRLTLGQPVNLFTELIQVLEPPVHRGKPYIGDLIQPLELGHDHLADHHGLDLPLTGGPELVLDAAQRGFDLLDADRALFQRAQQTGSQLVLVKGLATAILLDDPRQDQLGCLQGGETFLTGQAFPPSSHLTAVGDQPGVDDLGIVGAAKWTIHDKWFPESEARLAYRLARGSGRLAGLAPVTDGATMHQLPLSSAACLHPSHPPS